MDYLLMISAVVVVIIGLMLLHWTERFSYSPRFLAVTGFICVVITILDYVVPVWGTKKFGGTKAGVRGSTIGLIIGILVLPTLGIVIGPFGILGLLGGPFFGAYVGEKMGGTPDNLAWRSAFGSFVGFVAGTFMKICYTLVIGFYVIKDIIAIF